MMVQEDDTHVLYGPEPYQPFINVSLGRLYYDALSRCNVNYPAMVDAETNESLSYRDLFEYSCILADYLRELGYGKGSIMTISSHNNLQFFIPILSTLYLGAIMAPLNHNYTPEELRHTLTISKPKVIFCSEKVLQKYLDLKKEFNFIERILVIDSTKEFPGAASLINLLKKRQQSTNKWRNFKPLDGKAEELLCFILCSSGTTGLPKGVLLSHMNILIRLQHAKDPRYYQAQLGLRVLGVLPFFHGFGLITNLGSITNFIQVVIMKRFEERLFLETIQKYRINLLWLAPPLAVFLAKSPLVKNYDLSSVTELVSGAAPLGKNTQEELKRRLNISKVFQGYGLTEAALAVTLLQQSDIYKEGSSGKVVPFMKCKIRDPETGKSLPSNKVGELCFKGPMVMVGYYGNEKATKESFTSDGWLRTGDLGYYDEEGFFFIVDRLKELIKYKGFQVAPAELEALLLKHPKIRDCGVVGLPEELSGELPLAFVVKREGADLTEQEVKDYVASAVSSPKHLRGGVIFVNEIPKNASGKILRRELRGLLNKYKSKL